MSEIAVGLMAVGGSSILLAIILFFAWNVPGIQADLSGKTSRRRLENLKKVYAGNPESASTTSIDLIQELSAGNFSEDFSSGNLDNVEGISFDKVEPTGSLSLQGIVNQVAVVPEFAKPVQDDPFNELGEVAFVESVTATEDEFATGMLEEESTDPISNSPFNGVRRLCVIEELSSL